MSLNLESKFHYIFHSDPDLRLISTRDLLVAPDFKGKNKIIESLATKERNLQIAYMFKNFLHNKEEKELKRNEQGLANAILSEKPAVQLRGVELAVKYGITNLIPYLEEAYRKDLHFFQGKGLLQLYGSHIERYFINICNLLGDGSAALQAEAIGVLGAFTCQSSLLTILPYLESKVFDVRMSSIRALFLAGEKCLTNLLARLSKNENKDILWKLFMLI